MRYILPQESILNTMIIVCEQEKRRIIDFTDMENYQDVLREKIKEEKLDVGILNWECDYLDDKRVFKSSYFSEDGKKKQEILNHYLYGDIIYNEEILAYLCPLKEDSKIIQHYMMLPWIDLDDLYQFRRSFKLPEYGIFTNTLGERTPDDLEKLFEWERKVSCFFDDNLEEEIVFLEERQKNATKVLSKMKKVSNHSGK